MRFSLWHLKIAFLIFLAILTATVLTRLIPPLQSPDENVHLARADMISHGQWLLQPGTAGEGREGGYVDSNLIAFVEAMLSISGKGATKETARQTLEAAGKKEWAHQESYYNAAGTGYYLPIIYAPHAAGLYLSRKLDLTMHASYEFTRILVIATIFAIMAWAFSLYTPNLLSLMLLTTPMALFQLNSPTIDGLCAAMTILAIGLWFSTLHSVKYLNEGKLSLQEIVLYGLIIVLCTARTNLLPTLLIPLTLLFNRRSVSRFAVFLLVCTLTLGWIAFGISSTHDSRVVREHTTAEILISYISNPLEFFDLLFNTVSDDEIRRFYRDSYFGILGWLDTPIPRQAVRILYAFAIIVGAVLVAATRWRRELSTRATLLAIGVISTFLIFLALALTWTNYPADKISGIQGRYFLIPTLFIAAAIGRADGEIRPYRPVELFAFFAFLTYSLYILGHTLLFQYKMSNQYF
ncbi:MAG: DUF2142 domain-containing protein [Alcaligenaceae bacterium]|nr:MAG: DUF2142 domain-containing protein [Alcaligenaceae bacterium]